MVVQEQNPEQKRELSLVEGHVVVQHLLQNTVIAIAVQVKIAIIS